MSNPPVSQLAEETVLKTVKYEFESHQGDHPLFKPPTWKIYGPYQSKKDLRRRVIAYDGSKRITISYPKFIMECILGKTIPSDMEVHHKNEIEFDDRIENFEIRDSQAHLRGHRLSLPEFFKCPTCGEVFNLVGIKLSNFKRNKKRKPDMKGPYCSKSCAGKDNN